jgi:hypothetical protein
VRTDLWIGHCYSSVGGKHAERREWEAGSLGGWGRGAGNEGHLIWKSFYLLFRKKRHPGCSPLLVVLNQNTHSCLPYMSHWKSEGQQTTLTQLMNSKDGQTEHPSE